MIPKILFVSKPSMFKLFFSVDMTILDIGTDCVKPLYLAMKYDPDKIIGINEDYTNYTPAEIELKSKLFMNTEIRFYECSFFNDAKLEEILLREKVDRFDYVILSKTLHHLRSGECIAKERDPKHCCQEDEESCINRFKEKEIFESLLRYGKRIIVYEGFYPGENDSDKYRGRGGYLTTEEWIKTFSHIVDNYRVKLIQPSRLHLDEKELKDMDTILRKVDTLCFYVELVEEE